MINEHAVKVLKTYLQHLSAPAALLDEDLSIYWSNDDELFKHLTQHSDLPSIPVLNETIVSTVVNKNRIAFIISPVYKSKKKIGCYTCSARTITDSINLTRNTSMSDVLLAHLENFRSSINNIVNINQLARESLNDGNLEEQNEFLKRQIFYANKALTNSTNICYLFSSPVISNLKQRYCDIGDMVDEICAEVEHEIGKSGRHLRYTTVGRNSYAALNEKQFVVVLMNAIQCALLFSPCKSTLGVSVINSKNECEIQISNEPSTSAISSDIYDERKLIREVINKVVIDDFAGKCEFILSDEGNEITRIQIPTVPKTEEMFKASAPVYRSDRFNTVHIFIDEIISNEIE